MSKICAAVTSRIFNVSCRFGFMKWRCPIQSGYEKYHHPNVMFESTSSTFQNHPWIARIGIFPDSWDFPMAMVIKQRGFSCISMVPSMGSPIWPQHRCLRHWVCWYSQSAGPCWARRWRVPRGTPRGAGRGFFLGIAGQREKMVVSWNRAFQKRMVYNGKSY